MTSAPMAVAVSVKARPRRLGLFAASLVAGSAIAAGLWLSQPANEEALRHSPAAAPVELEEIVPTSRRIDPFESVVIVIRRNDTLDALFRKLELSLRDLAEMRQLPDVRRSLDRLRPGDVIMLTHLGGHLRSLTRRLSDTDTLSVTRVASGFAAEIILNPIETEDAALAGTIESSLFGAVDGAGGSDALAIALADVFKYDIDFVNEVQPGDSFAVAYERAYQDGEFLRDGEILAAEFVNKGRVYRAVRYVMPDGSVEYFTPEGENVRKAFLRFPVAFGRVSSRFNLARRHPILKTVRAHKGIDFAAPTGTAIKAAGNGRVIHRGVKGGYGNTVILAHPGSVTTLYAHMSRYRRGLRVGDKVKQGEVIGYIGMTGLATGPHLHYEYRVGGVHRNPATVPVPRAKSIPDDLREDFLNASAPLLAHLDSLSVESRTRVALASP